MKTLDTMVLNRRQVLALGLTSGAALGLAACGGNDDAELEELEEQSAEDTATEEVVVEDEQEAPEVDADAFDALLTTGPIASDEAIAASGWATQIKENGTLRVGGTRTSALFSLETVEDGHVRGFDAGLYQLLARYITGDENNYELTQVTSDTRESVLTTDQVDTVFATYSINAERQEIIDFAGPYYTSKQGILVAKDTDDISSVDDLNGKNVGVQSGSTGPTIVEEFAPDAVLQEFSTNEEARIALEQGRIDAYVIDETLLLGLVSRNPSKYKIVGESFGPEDPYGIGLPKGADGAVDFVNDFLVAIEDQGLWEDLWVLSIGERTGQENVPEPPAVGV